MRCVTSVAKGFSAPRKCSICQKTMFYKAYKCKHCRYRNQKKCSSHGSSSRRNSVPKCYTGDEHWSKVLQANEVNSNLAGWVTCKKHRVCQCGRIKHKTGKDHKEHNGKETNFFSSLYTRFCEWVANAKKDSAVGRQAGQASGGRPRSGSGGAGHFRPGHQDGSLTPGSPEEFHRFHHASVSSEDSELSSFYVASYSSTCSNLTLTSTSTTVSDGVRPHEPWPCSPSFRRLDVGESSDCVRDYCAYGDPYGSPLTPDFDFCPSLTDVRSPVESPSAADSRLRGPPSAVGFEYDRDTVIRSLDQKAASRRSRFRRTKHPSVSVWLGQGQKDDIEKHFLCATWPPTNRRKPNLGSISTDQQNNELEESVFDSQDLLPEPNSSVSYGMRESLGDCTIPFSDVEFGDCVRTGRRHEIYRGRWHGDVMIHTYSNLSDTEVEEFWNEVTKLSMIRHENIALFMGACLEPPNFAVITSVLKGVSLYQQIHLKSEKMSTSVCINTIRQVAQGMGYLHARGIVIRKLNSKNVYLEPKVKLCVMDYGMAEREYDRPEYGCIPRGNLCYVSPEIMRTIRINPPCLQAAAPYTKATDVYAFGTLLYETMVGQFPFSHMPPEVIIWQIGRGKRQSLKHLKLNSSLRILIEKCWSRNPENRLTFAEINKELQFNAGLHKRHSSSNPEHVNHQGLSNRPSTMFP